MVLTGRFEAAIDFVGVFDVVVGEHRVFSVEEVFVWLIGDATSAIIVGLFELLGIFALKRGNRGA